MNGAYLIERGLMVYETWLRLGIALFYINNCLDRNDVVQKYFKFQRAWNIYY